ncbi:MAG: hypothetical protein ACYDHH_15160 [Solirubrobacteraceae bacterium]
MPSATTAVEPGNLRASLAEAAAEGRALLPRTDAATTMVFMAGQTTQDSVEAWIASVEWLLRGNGLLLPRFRREPPAPPSASVVITMPGVPLRRRLEQKLANLDDIVRSF